MGLMINCKEATLLVEREFEDKVGIGLHIKLRLHLVLCKVCATYKSQSRILNSSIKNNFSEEPDPIFVEELKRKIKLRIS